MFPREKITSNPKNISFIEKDEFLGTLNRNVAFIKELNLSSGSVMTLTDGHQDDLEPVDGDDEDYYGQEQNNDIENVFGKNCLRDWLLYFIQKSSPALSSEETKTLSGILTKSLLMAISLYKVLVN